MPDVVLQPFIHWYVQRETVSKDGEIVEPVFPRAGAMLEFQFASVYEVKAYGTEMLPLLGRQQLSDRLTHAGCG